MGGVFGVSGTVDGLVPVAPGAVVSDPGFGVLEVLLLVSPPVVAGLLVPLAAAPLLPALAAAPASLLLGDDIDVLSAGERDAVELQAANAIAAAREISHFVIRTPDPIRSC